jgi:hypothetical protein
MITVRDTLKKLAPVIGEERMTALWRAYLIGNAIERRELEGLLEAYAAQALNDTPSSNAVGLFPPAPPTSCLGDIDLGQARYAGKDACLFGLRKPEMLRHLGIYGSSGCGKSNAIALILDGFIRGGTPFLLADFKRSLRGVMKDYPQLLVFTAGDAHTAPFRLNPLIPPPGTSTDVWAKKVIGALSHAYCQGAGSESLLITAVGDAYAEAAPTGRWPTFKDVHSLLTAQPARGRKGMWLDSATRAVKSISTGNAADVFCPDHPYDVERLLSQFVILEMDLLNPAEQTLLAEILLLWIIQYRMNATGRREELKHAIIIEEAHHLLRSPPGVGDGSEPVIHIALREARELCESIIIATQNASVVPVAVFGNQATTLAFHTKHAMDVRATAQAMLLKDEAKDELGRLPVGEAIVRVPRHPDPIHIRLIHRPIDKGSVSDADIRERMAFRLCSADTVAFHPPPTATCPIPALPPSDYKETNPSEHPSSHVPANLSSVKSPATTPKENGSEKNISFPEPSELERALLSDIAVHPFDGVVRRISRLQTSRRKGIAALKALEEEGLIKPENVFSGRAFLKLFDIINPAGRAMCHKHGIHTLPDITEGRIEHRYWVHRVNQGLQSSGWQTKVEHPVASDLCVDIHATKKEMTIAVLVETGRSNVEANIRRTVAAAYDQVWVVANAPKVAVVVKRLRGEYPQIPLLLKRPDEFPGNVTAT